MFAWDAFFYVGMPTLIVRMGKTLLFAWGAYFQSGMPIFTVKMATRPDAYIHVNMGIGMPIHTFCTASKKTKSPGNEAQGL